jgi:hypothetical protein
MKLRFRTILFQCALFAAAGVFAAPAPAAKSPGAGELDLKKIHSEYNDGNFEKVVNTLEAFMAAHKTYSFQDSLFIAKHLAVVYTANPETREKGKYYMYRLLTLLPSAKLVDMYVSDEIDRIFDKVREEFLARQHGFGVDTARVAVPEKAPTGAHGNAAGPIEPRPDSRPAPRKEGHAALWVTGGVAVAAAGLAATYFLIQSGPTPAPVNRVYSVPRN